MTEGITDNKERKRYEMAFIAVPNSIRTGWVCHAAFIAASGPGLASSARPRNKCGVTSV
jgi:hypothetical protein